MFICSGLKNLYFKTQHKSEQISYKPEEEACSYWEGKGRQATPRVPCACLSVPPDSAGTEIWAVYRIWGFWSPLTRTSNWNWLRTIPAFEEKAPKRFRTNETNFLIVKKLAWPVNKFKWCLFLYGKEEKRGCLLKKVEEPKDFMYCSITSRKTFRMKKTWLNFLSKYSWSRIINQNNKTVIK